MDIALVLASKFSSAQWVLDGDEYSGLDWLDETPKPSESELKALWPEVEFEAAIELVELERQAAYQAESDPLFFKSQRGKGSKDEWLAKVAEIDERLPYPVKPKGK